MIKEIILLKSSEGEEELENYLKKYASNHGVKYLPFDGTKVQIRGVYLTRLPAVLITRRFQDTYIIQNATINEVYKSLSKISEEKTEKSP